MTFFSFSPWNGMEKAPAFTRSEAKLSVICASSSPHPKRQKERVESAWTKVALF